MRLLLSSAALLGLLTSVICQQAHANAGTAGNPGSSGGVNPAGPNPRPHPAQVPPAQTLPVIPPTNHRQPRPRMIGPQAQPGMRMPASPPTRGYPVMNPMNPWAAQQLQSSMPWFQNNIGFTLDRLDHPCGMSMRRRQTFRLFDHPDPFCECRTTQCDGGMLDTSHRSQQDCGGPQSFARCCCAGTPYSSMMWPGMMGMTGGFPGMQRNMFGAMPGAVPGSLPGPTGFPGQIGFPGQQPGRSTGFQGHQPGRQSVFPRQQPGMQGAPRFGTSPGFGTMQDFIRQAFAFKR